MLILSIKDSAGLLWSCAPLLQRPLLWFMDPEAGRLPVQVLGENEALQQFFNGGIFNGVSSANICESEKA